MFVSPRYITDFGLVLGYLKMDIAFVKEDLRSLRQIKNLSEITGIIPPLLESSLLKINHSCQSYVSPRFALINLQDDRQIKLSYPFQPGSSDWQIFWNDLLANPQIILAKGTGESASNSFLKKL
jgi:hypothetical protein